jgi:hypothetical protein
MEINDTRAEEGRYDPILVDEVFSGEFIRVRDLLGCNVIAYYFFGKAF